MTVSVCDRVRLWITNYYHYNTIKTINNKFECITCFLSTVGGIHGHGHGNGPGYMHEYDDDHMVVEPLPSMLPPLTTPLLLLFVCNVLDVPLGLRVIVVGLFTDCSGAMTIPPSELLPELSSPIIRFRHVGQLAFTLNHSSTHYKYDMYVTQFNKAC